MTEPRYVTKNSPCVDQTTDEIAVYYRAAKAGDAAVVRQTQGHVLQYAITAVEGTNPARGQIYIGQFGAFYTKHGKNCFEPKGQSSLVVPTPEVLAWAEEHPRGEVGYVWYRFEGYQALFSKPS